MKRVRYAVGGSRGFFGYWGLGFVLNFNQSHLIDDFAEIRLGSYKYGDIPPFIITAIRFVR